MMRRGTSRWARRLGAAARLQRTDCTGDLPDVIGARPAAAADQADTGPDEAAGVGRELTRRREVDVPSLDIARTSGVGLRRQPRLCDTRDALDRLQHGRRPDTAVDADHVRAERFEGRRELFGRRAIEGVAVLLDGHLGHDGQRAGRTHGADGRAHLRQVAEGFEHEQVHATLEEGIDLLPEEGLGFIHAGLTPGLDTHAERTDGTGDEGLAARGGPRQPRPLDVDLSEFVGQAEAAQLHAVGAERVGFDDVRARAHVLTVHAGDQVRLAEVQRVEGAVDEDALGIEHRAHRAVADKHPLIERFKKRTQGAAGGCTSRSVLSHTKSLLLYTANS